MPIERGGSGERPDSGGQGLSCFPALRGRRADDPPGARGSARAPPCRASTPFGGGSLKRRILPTLEELGRSAFNSVQPSGQGAFSRARSTRILRFDGTDFRNVVPRFAPEARKANRAVVDLLGTIAGRKKATPAQIALAWVLVQKPWIAPIPGTTKQHRLKENVAAASIELGEEDLREIESATSRMTVQGARYPESAQRMINR